MYAEIGAPDNFEIVGQAWMCDRKVVRCEVGLLGQAVDERGVWVVQDLAESVVLHHDQKHVVKARYPLRARPLCCASDAGKHRHSKH